MDPTIQKDLDLLIEELKRQSQNVVDPVSKLIVASLVYQARNLSDRIEALPGQVIDRLLSCFVPPDKVRACPAVCLLEVQPRARKITTPHSLTEGLIFSYKAGPKETLFYSPIFCNTVIPVVERHLLTPQYLIFKDERIPVASKRKGQVWLGMELSGEIESLENVSFYIKGTRGVTPSGIYTAGGTNLQFTLAERMADIPMAEPFDSQKMSPWAVEMMEGWQRILADSEEGFTLYITDRLKDRDTFKSHPYPKPFQQILEDSDLDRLEAGSLWLLFDFGDSYEVPEKIEIIPNVVPSANIAVSTVTLTQLAPIARLSKEDGSYFLGISETSLTAQKQGFAPVGDEVSIRDFDASSYDSGQLYRDVRNLYNRFVDDYHAFIDYHQLKDGELVKSLREIVNRIGKGVEHSAAKNRFEDGIYVMRNIALSGTPSPVKVSFLTTFGRLGNSPRVGEKMENRKDAALEKDVRVVADARGGENPASPDQRYELLRYYTLTADRLFTRADVDAFLRMKLIREFGKEEAKRISYKISIQGAPGNDRLVRGLYIDISFKDDKNYCKALGEGLAKKLERQITEKSCISMPVIVTLINKENE